MYLVKCIELVKCTVADTIENAPKNTHLEPKTLF